MPNPITREQLRERMANGDIQVVDVLPPREFSDGHLPGAVNIPLKKLDRSSVGDLDPQSPVAVYCHDTQ